MDYKIVYDTTPAVTASIESIVTPSWKRDLVTLVVFIFLQNFRATLIPLHGSRVADRHLYLLSDARVFDQHPLDVRARAQIGIVVDDAIVVVGPSCIIEHGMTRKMRRFRR
jgi:multidrug efflux pump subunit AcrB